MTVPPLRQLEPDVSAQRLAELPAGERNGEANHHGHLWMYRSETTLERAFRERAAAARWTPRAWVRAQLARQYQGDWDHD